MFATEHSTVTHWSSGEAWSSMYVFMKHVPSVHTLFHSLQHQLERRHFSKNFSFALFFAVWGNVWGCFYIKYPTFSNYGSVKKKKKKLRVPSKICTNSDLCFLLHATHKSRNIIHIYTHTHTHTHTHINYTWYYIKYYITYNHTNFCIIVFGT